MEGSPQQQLKKFLEPYERDELISLIMGITTENNDICNLFLKKIKNDKKWCKLFVHGLPFTTTEQTLETYYSKWGTVKEAVVLKNKNGDSKGYGFVTFSTADEALNAVKVDKKKIDGRITHCNLAYKGNPKKFGFHSNNNNNNNGEYRPYDAKGFNNIPISPSQRENVKDRRLFVYSLAWKTDDQTLHKTFSEYGEIQEAVVIRDKHTGKSKGYGFVTFQFPESASAALNHPEKIIDGRKTNCDYAWKRERNRGGGGSHSTIDDDNNSQPVMTNMNLPLPQQPMQSFDPLQMMNMNNNNNINNNRINSSMIDNQQIQGQMQPPGGNMDTSTFMTMNNAPAYMSSSQGGFQGPSSLGMPIVATQASLMPTNQYLQQQSRQQGVIGSNMGVTPSTPPNNIQQLSPMKNTQSSNPSNMFNATSTQNQHLKQSNPSSNNVQSSAGKNQTDNSNNNNQNSTQSLNVSPNNKQINQSSNSNNRPHVSNTSSGTNAVSGSKTTKKPASNNNSIQSPTNIDKQQTSTNVPVSSQAQKSTTPSKSTNAVTGIPENKTLKKTNVAQQQISDGENGSTDNLENNNK